MGDEVIKTGQRREKIVWNTIESCEIAIESLKDITLSERRRIRWGRHVKLDGHRSNRESARLYQASAFIRGQVWVVPICIYLPGPEHGPDQVLQFDLAFGG